MLKKLAIRVLSLVVLLLIALCLLLSPVISTHAAGLSAPASHTIHQTTTQYYWRP